MNTLSVIKAVIHACRGLLLLATIASSHIICMSDSKEDPCPEFTHRKERGSQQRDKKREKKSTCRAHKYVIGASHHPHTQKKKLHGKGKKAYLSPQNAISKAQQDVEQLIAQQEWEDDFEVRTYADTLKRLQRMSENEHYQTVQNALEKPWTLPDNIDLSFFDYCKYIAATLDAIENLPNPQFLNATVKHLRYIAGKQIVHVPHDNREQIEILPITK
jgi:hypothetical protein